MSRVALTLDHVILRSPEPRTTLDELSVRLAAPVLAPVQEVAGIESGIVRTGSLDIEVLGIGAEPPVDIEGYGLGFTSDATLEESAVALRAAGFPTSAPVRTTASGRRWGVIHVSGLLPDPFPMPTSTRAPGVRDRLSGVVSEWLTGRFPELARFATREPGDSMVVVTEYEFDVEAWRAAAGQGPHVLAVEVGIGNSSWGRLPLGPGPLILDPAGPTGVRRIVLEGVGEDFELGSVSFAYGLPD
jgi:hypothetical protein